MAATPAAGVHNKKRNLTEAAKVERLRKLMLGPDAHQAINQLTSKNETERVTEVISEALQRRAERDDTLAQSLSPLVDSAIDTSIKDHPDRITNVIFPVMGPAIRKAVASALQELVQNINQVLSEGLSIRSWSWRFQAWRAGKSYAEFVLIKTLEYRVEQVLLIHRETGLLLQEASINNLRHEDPELVSAMLTAINDFACDAFHRDRELCIDSIRFGDYTLQLVAGPFALLAAAVRGTPTQEISTKLSQIIEKIHLEHTPLLVNFSGDKASLEPVSELLRCCLLQKKSEPRYRPPWFAYAFIFAVTVCLAAWGAMQYEIYSQQQRVLAELERQGLLVLDQSLEGRHWHLATLRSEGSLQPQEIVKRLGVGQWSFSFDDRVLPVVKKAYAPVALSPQQQALEQWNQTIARLQSVRLHFQPASALLVTEDQASLAQLVVGAKRLASLAERAGIIEYHLILTGFADTSGSDTTNLRLSQERAQLVKDHLLANGVTAEKVAIWGVGALDAPMLSTAEQRVVSMQVFYQSNNDFQGTL